MDITKAKKIVELTKDEKKVLVTLWDDGKISTCVEEEKAQSCQTCDGDEQLCNDYINHLKEQGYEASEMVLGPEVEESLARFLEEREIGAPSEPEVKEE